MNNPEQIDSTDGAGSTPLCVVTANDFDWGDDAAPLTPLAETIVYEVHVKGFTQLHPDVPEGRSAARTRGSRTLPPSST